MTPVVISKENLREAVIWLKDNNLVEINDYTFMGSLGLRSSNFTFLINDDNTAMLFKLAFGGL